MTSTPRLVATLLSATFLLPAAASAAPAPASSMAEKPAARTSTETPLVIGHRGASGHRPEHTLAAYALAARMGADFIEPDLVSTRDGVLVARHENEISGTTDISDRPEFAARKTTKVIDGETLTGWFTEDFSLAELRTLRAKERIPALRQRNTIYDGRYRIPTFQEIINLSEDLTEELDRPVGIYPETKHPSFFRSIGLPLERPLVRVLRDNDLDEEDSAVFVQSFEVGNLKLLDRRIDAPLVQLYGSKTSSPADDASRTYAEMATTAGLEKVADYADGVGPSKDYIVPRDATGKSLAPTTFINDAHSVGLLVHPYTFRNENAFLPLELRRGAVPFEWGSALAEYDQFFALGVDGVFSDYPDTAIEARDGGETTTQDRRPARAGRQLGS